MSSSTTHTQAGYRERLWPSPWFFIALLLIIPAVALVTTPINAVIAVPLAIGLYLVIALSLAFSAPVIAVRGDVLLAGNAHISVDRLGPTELLETAELRRAIGPGLDARAHLLVRGYIHRGVRIRIDDDNDPAPYWILTTRRPQMLVRVIEQAQRARPSEPPEPSDA